MNQILAFLFITAMWISAMVFVGRLERREHFWVRVVCCIAAFYLMTAGLLFLVPVRMMVLRIIWRVIGMPVLMLFINVCWNLSWSLSLYYGMWAFMAWQLLGELLSGISSFLQYIHKGTEVNELILCILIFVVGYLIIAITLAKWMPEDSKEKLGPRQLLSAIIIFSAYQVVGYTPGIDNIAPISFLILVI